MSIEELGNGLMIDTKTYNKLLNHMKGIKEYKDIGSMSNKHLIHFYLSNQVEIECYRQGDNFFKDIINKVTQFN